MNLVKACIFDMNHSKVVTYHFLSICVTSGEHFARYSSSLNQSKMASVLTQLFGVTVFPSGLRTQML